MISAANVARAAPGTPMAKEKIKIGSNTALNTLANALILTGVLVSNIPFDESNLQLMKSACQSTIGRIHLLKRTA